MGKIISQPDEIFLIMESLLSRTKHLIVIIFILNEMYCLALINTIFVLNDSRYIVQDEMILREEIFCLIIMIWNIPYLSIVKIMKHFILSFIL
jgi:hypothetical protein